MEVYFRFLLRSLSQSSNKRSDLMRVKLIKSFGETNFLVWRWWKRKMICFIVDGFDKFIISSVFLLKVMPIKKQLQLRPQATNSPNHLMHMQTMIPRPVMSTPQGFKKRQLMTEVSVRNFWSLILSRHHASVIAFRCYHWEFPSSKLCLKKLWWWKKIWWTVNKTIER